MRTLKLVGNCTVGLIGAYLSGLLLATYFAVQHCREARLMWTGLRDEVEFWLYGARLVLIGAIIVPIEVIREEMA